MDKVKEFIKANKREVSIVFITLLAALAFVSIFS